MRFIERMTNLPDGNKDRTIDLSILENSQAMNVAIEDFTNNWPLYVER